MKICLIASLLLGSVLAVLLYVSHQYLLERNLLASQDVTGEGVIVAKTVAHDLRAVDVTYEVNDGRTSGRRTAVLPPMVGTKLAVGDHVAVRYVPGRPEFSRLMLAEMRDLRGRQYAIMTIAVSFLFTVFVVGFVGSWVECCRAISNVDQKLHHAMQSALRMSQRGDRSLFAGDEILRKMETDEDLTLASWRSLSEVDRLAVWDEYRSASPHWEREHRRSNALELWVAVALLLLLTLPGVVGLIWEHRVDRALEDRGVEGFGRIVDMWPGDRQSIIQFDLHTRDGKPLGVSDKADVDLLFWNTAKVGDEVPLRYVADDPGTNRLHNVEILDDRDMLAACSVAGAFVGGMFLLLAVGLRRDWFNHERKRMLKNPPPSWQGAYNRVTCNA